MSSESKAARIESDIAVLWGGSGIGVRFAAARVRPIAARHVFLPLLPFAGGIAASMLGLWEGVFALSCSPRWESGWRCWAESQEDECALPATARSANLTLASVMILPILIGPWEQPALVREELRRIETVTDIQARPCRGLGQHRTRSRHTQRRTSAIVEPAHRISRPVEATLSFEGLGGLRNASFQGGVPFIETVDSWEKEHRLAFSIHAQTAQILKTTLDEHVAVGGAFLMSCRVLERLPNGWTRLHLCSQHRRSTDFNWYARLWTDAIMADLQNTILHVIRNCCERAVQQIRTE